MCTIGPDHRLLSLSLLCLLLSLLLGSLCAAPAIFRTTLKAEKNSTPLAPIKPLLPPLEELAGQTIKLDKLSYRTNLLSEESELLSVRPGIL